MSRLLPKKNNPLILTDAAPSYEDLLSRRRLGKTNLMVKPTQIGTSNATKPENLGVFEYAHLRAPLPRDLQGSEIFPSHTPAQHPETYFLMRRSKDGFVSATGMFKIAFPWAKTEEEKNEREYLKSREHTSQEEVAGNVWISPEFALELSREYKMYDWVRALLDPTDIVQSPTSAKKQITPPPKFELPMDEPSSSRRSRRSVSPSKKSTSPRKSRTVRSAKDVLSTPSTAAANSNLQEALDITASMEASANSPIRPVAVDDVEVKEAPVQASPEKKKGRKSKKAAAETEEDKEEEEEQKEKKKSEKKEKKKTEKTEKKKKDLKEEMAVEVTETALATEDSTKTTLTLDMPINLPEVPSAAETEEMIAKAKEMVEEAIKSQAEGSVAGPSSVTVTKKRKPEEDDEETAAEASQRAKKAKVLEEKLKRERVRNRALFGVSAAFALAATIPYFF
ncbi:uncharacterized protein N7473_005075 [Penicillium subrubescens]|jgi:hypothetical protein|uniref:Cell pattern formation-associated protein stuA n=1 Tax=Penicillium subrubescens TaxID=1316194 RepID=A0A1Q5UDI8_9EURO|nr:uncharacterized protein N7473_005075 [Penicillium subrubescens]KAJ5901005.1 hypothetical protein N7473_005075 [Penicillium subrubescens]OKP10523.1 hypothetical protein PENSUB_3826 [Penicillium subrubescens]